MALYPSSEYSQFAPAKINLFLHVTGKRHDGYHLLQSMIAFADFGDDILIRPAGKFSLTIENSPSLPAGKNNLIVQAAKMLANELNRSLDMSIHLIKRIPVGAGLGGGSANAAATIQALLNFWNEEIQPVRLQEILIHLGADVPVCYHGKACLVEGIGEIIKPVQPLPSIPTVLVYPEKFCSTAEVFKSYRQNFSEPVTMTEKFDTQENLYKFLDMQKNDLTATACQKIPEIEEMLEMLNRQQGCALSRLSGSGSACFGLFGTTRQSEEAAKNIKKEKPDWWVRPVILH